MIVSVLPLGEALESIGLRARELRAVRGLRQEDLALRAGVGVATLQRFESTGRATLENALRIAIALNADEGFARLFEAPPFASLDDALERPGPLKRRRVRRRG